MHLSYFLKIFPHQPSGNQGGEALIWLSKSLLLYQDGLQVTDPLYLPAFLTQFLAYRAINKKN